MYIKATKILIKIIISISGFQFYDYVVMAETSINIYLYIA